MPGVFAQFFPTSLTFARSTGLALALAPAPILPLTSCCHLEVEDLLPGQGSPSLQQQLLHSSGVGVGRPRWPPSHPVKSGEGGKTGTLCFVSFSGVPPAASVAALGGRLVTACRHRSADSTPLHAINLHFYEDSQVWKSLKNKPGGVVPGTLALRTPQRKKNCDGQK